MSLEISLKHKQGAFSLDVDFAAAGGITVLYGPSGSGKTTIVNAVAGLLRPDEGRIKAGNQLLLDTARRIFLPTHRRRLGYIFQEGRLFPHLTVRQNLLYGRWFAPKGARAENMDKVVEMLGIGPLLARRPAGLSGGEKQRVAIGRALLAAPALILADEPLSALDEARKAEILPYFERLRDEVAVPILYVSHSPSEVARIASRVVALKSGLVARIGSASEVLGDPAATGAESLGAVIEARLVAQHSDGLSELEAGGVPLLVPALPGAPGTRVRLRVPASGVTLALQRLEGISALNQLPATITRIDPPEGAACRIALESPAGALVARVTSRSVAALGLRPGLACHAILKTLAIAPQDLGGSAAPKAADAT